MAMQSSTHNFRKFLSVAVGLWFAVVSCALGCSQVVPATFQLTPLSLLATRTSQAEAADVPSCH
ncbi:MAG TPA: hypothetical protein VFP96_15790, partial [Candidatus Acidoferrum sp.]|nr:hypothetical protein [Candidatus Acidoferrum sp.]